MTRYLVKQFFLSLLKLFIFVTFMFFFIQIMMPGDFVDQFALFWASDQREELRVQLGLNLPIAERYIQWLGKLIRFDLGYSFYGNSIVEVLKNTVPPTLLVFLSGTAIAFLIGLWLGKRTAWRGPGLISGTATLGSITLFTSFPPWLAFLLAYFFTRGKDFRIMGEIGGLHAAGFEGLNTELWRNIVTSPSKITGYMVTTLILSTLVFLLINALLARFTKLRIPTLIMIVLICAGAYASWNYLGIQSFALDILRISWLASLTYILISFGETMIIMQSSMTDVLNEEFVKTAKAKGLPASKVRERHAARNALLPVLSRLVISLPYLITGVVIIESSVGWPGMGTNMWNALYWQNMPVVMNTLLIVGAIALVARLFLDVLLAYLDPRIRYAYSDPTRL